MRHALAATSTRICRAFWRCCMHVSTVELATLASPQLRLADEWKAMGSTGLKLVTASAATMALTALNVRSGASDQRCSPASFAARAPRLQLEGGLRSSKMGNHPRWIAKKDSPFQIPRIHTYFRVLSNSAHYCKSRKCARLR